MPSRKKKSKKKKSTGGGGKQQPQQPQSIAINAQNAQQLLFSEPIVEPTGDPVPAAEKRRRADTFKTLGNEAFKAKEYVLVSSSSSFARESVSGFCVYVCVV